MVEVADPGQPSEAGRLAQKSADAFAAGELGKAQRLAGDAALASAYTHLQQIVGVMELDEVLATGHFGKEIVRIPWRRGPGFAGLIGIRCSRRLSFASGVVPRGRRFTP